jgi:hypothetical protein
MVVHIVDSVPGRKTGTYEWDAPSPRLTLRQIIAERVRREVAAYNQAVPDVYSGFVQPAETEKILNGERSRRRELDPLHEIRRALQAFETQGFVVFAGGEQIHSLDQEIDLAASPEVEFIKMVPLAGG